MLSNYEPLLKALITKLQTITVNGILINPDNIIIGETTSFLIKDETTFYPRLEILPVKYIGHGYVSQTQIECEYRFGIGGFLLRATEEVTAQDTYNCTKFAQDVATAIWSFHSDAIQGNPPCPEFESLVGFPEAFFEHSTNPKLEEFILLFGVNVSEAVYY